MTKPLFVAIDVETTLNGNEDVGLAHPMHPDNRIVLFGMSNPYTPLSTVVTVSDMDLVEGYLYLAKDESVFCGHNISFDLLYLYRTNYKIKHKLQQHTVWDTQLA